MRYVHILVPANAERSTTLARLYTTGHIGTTAHRGFNLSATIWALSHGNSFPIAYGNVVVD